MFVLGNFFSAVGIVLRVFVDFETAVIIISAILSWIPGIRQFGFYNFLRNLADIVERPLRRFIPNIGYVDITPLIAILILIFVDRFLAQTLIDLGWTLK